jgi:hypothetical protein
MDSFSIEVGPAEKAASASPAGLIRTKSDKCLSPRSPIDVGHMNFVSRREPESLVDRERSDSPPPNSAKFTR